MTDETLTFDDQLRADSQAVNDAREAEAQAEAEALQVEEGGVAPEQEAAPEAEPTEGTDHPHDQDDEPSHEERTRKAYIRARQAERKARELEQQLAAARGQRPESRDETVQREAAQMARQMQQHEAAVQTQRRIRESAERDYKDFQQVLGQYAEAFPDWGGVPQPLIEAAMEASEGNEHKVLYHLGRNLDEAERIMGLPPARMGAAVAKLAAKLTAPPPPKPVSNAPRPPAAQVSTAAVPTQKDPSKMSMAEYIAYEDAREAERKMRPWSRR